MNKRSASWDAEFRPPDEARRTESDFGIGGYRIGFQPIQTRLLVSVRDAAEAESAWMAGANLIDVKEPHRGPLGAADPSVVAEVTGAVDGRVPISAALGELGQWEHYTPALRWQWATLRGVSYAKLGLAGCLERKDWPDRWRIAIEQMPRRAIPVAVVYADWEAAQAPRPAQILDLVEQTACKSVLIDTYDKTQGSLLDHWHSNVLDKFVSRLRSNGRTVVLGGSLTLRQLPTVLQHRPDYVAVRGAVCDGARIGRVQPAKIRHWATALAKAQMGQPTTRLP